MVLTLQDCIALSDLTEEEILAIAEHEHIPEIVAAELGNYGRTLILEHSGGYQSVIAGIGRVDVAVGQDVLMGETLGSMPVPQNGHTDTVSLYYELRQFGRPIDPFQGLMTAQR